MQHSLPTASRAATKAITFASVLGLVSPAWAFSIDTGNPDVDLRFDNTVRYTLGWRMESPDSRIYHNNHYDESDLKFDKGDLVQNRVDLLTELDMSYQRRMGFRLSAASWYDNAYKDDDVKTWSGSTFDSSYDHNNYSHTTERYYRGPSGEILDAFVFNRFDLGSVPVNVRAGRHTVFWGEGLLFPGHAISYSQAPIDGRKAVANPGTETKELFLPLGQVSAQAQVTSNLSLAAQYFYEWSPTRAPEGGTYFGNTDFGVAGPDRFPVAPGFDLAHLKEKEPGNSGNWGLAARYAVDAIDATVGLYYRQFDDYNPAGLQIVPGAGGSPLPAGYRFVYVENTKLYGASFTKQVGTAAVGVDLSYRDGTQLYTETAGADGKPAIGNTWHLVANSLWLLPSTPIYDTGVFMAEMAYSRLDKVTHNKNVFTGEGYAECEGRNKWDGCATKDFVGIAANFTPQWLSVYPSIDLSLPITVNYGVYGNAASGGGNQGASTWSVGLTATYETNTEVGLRYSDQTAHTKYSDGAVVGGNNPSLVGLTDRGWLALTFKTGF
ncbi:DUF1302 family protein [Pseudomonas citronellolis]|uniref:DUF1302 family protein n=1 Tax=Pseudomonas citronellolis TaxID=53408 RepID=A0AAW6P9U1_9PSED|nr:DUF1302 family protein [Pseudomonas citronellolis]MDF3842954.1 DUF1302 family protein [Pseudomonas citronellolis]